MAKLKLTFYEDRQSRMEIWRTRLLRIGLGLWFISLGSDKFAESGEWVRVFEGIGLGHWFRYFTGIVQIAGGALVLIPKTFPFGIIALASTMAGAMASWIFFLGSPFNAIFPGMLLLGILALGGDELLSLQGGRERRRRGSE